MSPRLQALCCVCGELRSCERPRNHREDNYWLRKPVDRNWQRETGDLKCGECGKITRHALILPDGHWAQDHAEMMQRIATGNVHSRLNDSDLAEVRSNYRKGLPLNPNLNHFRYDSDAQEAWDAGRRTVTALCGATMPVERDPSVQKKYKHKKGRADDDRQIKPMVWRDQEYEDPDTGLWWDEIDCVDCLRVWHAELLRQRQAVLSKLMTEFLAALLADKGSYPKTIDLVTVDSLIDALTSAGERIPQLVKESSR